MWQTIDSFAASAPNFHYLTIRHWRFFTSDWEKSFDLWVKRLISVSVFFAQMAKGCEKWKMIGKRTTKAKQTGQTEIHLQF